jgi:uncharacterized protein
MMHEPDAHVESAAHVSVQARKFDGRLHRQWPARLVAQQDTLVVLDGVFVAEVQHPLLGLIARGTLSTEYYWTDRWYSIFRFRTPERALRNYYCNINQPARFDGRVLSFIDLDIDVLVSPDFTYRVLDEDEFERHALEFNYAPELRAHVQQALAELLSLIERREFPFSA